VVYNTVKIDDSGQAGMTFNEDFSTFYETINIQFGQTVISTLVFICYLMLAI